MFDTKTVEIDLGGRALTIETGRMARQAHGAVVVSYGGTVVLVTAVAAEEPREGIDFFPLTVNFQSKTFAAGKIPGGFFKREGRPPDYDTLASRLIDRPIRPLFPKGFRSETQIIATVLSHDSQNSPDVLGIVGASAALSISDIPFQGPIAAVRVGYVDGEYVVNPTLEQLERSRLNLVVAGTRDAVTMVESGSKMLSEEEVLKAIELGHAEIRRIVELQDRLVEQAGKPKREIPAVEPDPEIEARVAPIFAEHGVAAYNEPRKKARYALLRQAKKALVEALTEEERLREKEYLAAFDDLAKRHVRRMILEEGRRIDGRGLADIRPIDCQVGVLPRTHGSALFTRGETQALVVTTLGTSSDEQLIDALEGEYYKRFMLHYNFPPFSVGEARFLRAPSRREIGHGALAERALEPLLPDQETFPYTIRVVSEVLESNGSSSMATVCGGSLSLMDAGVPVAAPVAGIAMGLIIEGDRYAVLSDILGDEDHLGDMDFKVAGTREGITALQMDIKVAGITPEIMRQALEQARQGRLHILGEMEKAISAPRPDISPYAPRITVIKINPEKIKDVIGPGGKMIRKIIQETQTSIDIEDDGSVMIASTNEEQCKKAIKMIEDLTQEAEVGRVYEGIVRRVTDYGAFVEIFPGTDGLLHISEIDKERVNKVTDYMKEGDTVPVKVISIDNTGRIKLSRKAALYPDEPSGGNGREEGGRNHRRGGRR
ncbi:MAG: polyribonucleotide nucleotidyltransferase [Candidatus Dadabacteria bacterium]|nr:MAG: polyribonucleotide nucleotidyltransferase [Candidatus Dadabacteria bacterium]